MGVYTRGKTLVIDFRCYLPSNRRVRCREVEGPDNPKNRKRVDQKWKAIQYHLERGTFDYLKFFPHGAKANHFEKGRTQITFAEYWEKWLQGLAIRGWTEDSYKYHFNKLFDPHFGTWHLSDITEQEVLIFRRLLLEDGYKASSVNTFMKTLGAVLKNAARQGLIDTDPCKDIKRLKESKPEMEPFSFEELTHLMDYYKERDPEWHDILLFWSRTGLRPGEFYALRWERIDFFNRQILIKESRPHRGGLGAVKTEYSDRVINMRPAVYEALKRQQARTGLMDKWVFMAPPNRRVRQMAQWTPGGFRKAFKYRLRLAGIKVRPAQQLRHTFATLHIAAGESITWVSKTLGHASVKTTLHRYNRFIPNLTRDDGSAFENVFSKNKIGHNLVTRTYNSL